MTTSIGYLIVGLGNPGPRYDGTRHNVGFQALDELARQHDISLKKLKFKGLTGDGQIGGQRVLLLKPQTYMNLSGQSVRAALEFYKLPSERMVVLYDDVSLPVGKLRVRGQGSDGGHNGIKDILYQVQSDVFARVKIGVGAPPNPEYAMADWVLSGFSANDKTQMAEAVERACKAATVLLSDGLTAAMNQFNGN